MRIDEITKRADTLYLMVDYNFEMPKIAKVAAKRGIEVYDEGKASNTPMAFGVRPNSLDAEYFMDALKTWGYNFKDVSDLWSRRAEVARATHRGEHDKVAKAFVHKDIEKDFDAE